MSHFRAHGTVPNPGEDATQNEHQLDRHRLNIEAYGYPPPPPPVVVIAPWGAPGPGYYYYYPTQDGNGYWYLPAIYPSNLPLHAAPPAHDHAPSISQAPRASTRATADIAKLFIGSNTSISMTNGTRMESLSRLMGLFFGRKASVGSLTCRKIMSSPRTLWSCLEFDLELLCLSCSMQSRTWRP